jgi:hypothetical protein
VQSPPVLNGFQLQAVSLKQAASVEFSGSSNPVVPEIQASEVKDKLASPTIAAAPVAFELPFDIPK